MLLPRRLILGAVGTLPLARVARGAVARRLTILHINDVHSRHEPVDRRALTCTAGEACYGGTPRLATAVAEQRRAAEADGRAVVLLDAGDQFQGSLFFTAHEGMAELAVQHALGVDAMAVGNHEFDKGPAVLGRYLAAARFPVLSANLAVEAEPALAGRIAPFTLIERGGIRLGVVGLTTREAATSSSPGPAVRFLDPGAALRAAVAAARAQGASTVVALSHLGLAQDLGLEGVALVVGGHSHTLLSNDEPGALGPAPVRAPGGPAVVQAACFARYLGRVDLDLAADGSVLALAAGCRHVGLDTPEEPSVAAIVARFAAPLAALRARPVATLAAPFSVTACRIAPCAFGALVAAALRQAARGGGDEVARVGLMNAGGLRTGLPAGPVSLGQVMEALPFGNMLATVSVSGADLAAAVRHGIASAGRGGFAQWSGLRLRPDGIEVEHDSGRWERLDFNARYLVATNNFLRQGGDGYTMLAGADAYDAGPALTDLVAEALAQDAR